MKGGDAPDLNQWAESTINVLGREFESFEPQEEG
jgi:hypothetical protein